MEAKAILAPGTMKSHGICCTLETCSEDKGPSKLRFWEIDQFFKCPTVGICLTLKEQKQILKKAAVSVKGKSPFEIHEILVGCSEKENRVSKQADRLLSRKYGDEIAPLLALSESVFMGRWAADFHEGRFSGTFWAAAVRADLGPESRGRIFGDVHMSMHGNIEQSMQFKRELAFHRKTAAKMSAKAKEALRSRKTLQKKNALLMENQRDLQFRLNTQEREICQLNDRLSGNASWKGIEALKSENRRLRLELAYYVEEAEEKDARLADIMKENRRLLYALDKEKEAVERLHRELKNFIQAPPSNGFCDQTCPSYDLCRKRVLMVGGLTKMTPLYRDVIEGSNGVFEYHDGYMKGGAKKLETRVRQADMVLCPITCNSHAACDLVKKLGKKYNKPVRLLSSSSLSAIGEALSGKGGVYASNN